MEKLLRYSGLSLFMMMGVYVCFSQTETFRPASHGLLQTFQDPGSGPPSGFEVNFVTNGPFGKDWIYGSWLDSDSLVRSVGYRKGGKWVSLPFHVVGSHYTGDIAQYGDTMYIGGFFKKVIIEKDSTVIPNPTLLKFHDDSIWAAPYTVHYIDDMEVSGDSLLIWASGYQNSDTTIIGPHLLTTDREKTWKYPYSMVHPTETTAYFGAIPKLKIEGGNIYSLNDAGQGHYTGVVKWDGLKWSGYGNGIQGTFSKAADFAFYKSELYMAGSFTKREDSRNPGEFVAKWNGSYWESVGGGLSAVALDLFKYKNTLLCKTNGDTFGDVYLPYLAGWDGHQWCGTPLSYTGGIPQSFGFIDDTLYAAYRYLPASTNGSSLSYINYFDGDYLHGPDAICSTPGLGEEENTLAKEAIEVYPNPATDVLYVNLPLQAKTATYQLLALDGRQVQAGTLTPGENTLKMAEKLKGVLLLKIEMGNGVVVKKVVLED